MSHRSAGGPGHAHQLCGGEPVLGCRSSTPWQSGAVRRSPVTTDLGQYPVGHRGPSRARRSCQPASPAQPPGSSVVTGEGGYPDRRCRCRRHRLATPRSRQNACAAMDRLGWCGIRWPRAVVMRLGEVAVGQGPGVDQFGHQRAVHAAHLRAGGLVTSSAATRHCPHRKRLHACSSSRNSSKHCSRSCGGRPTRVIDAVPPIAGRRSARSESAWVRAELGMPARGPMVSGVISATGGFRHGVGRDGCNGCADGWRWRGNRGRDGRGRCWPDGLDGGGLQAAPAAGVGAGYDRWLVCGRAQYVETIPSSAPADSAEAASLDHRAGDGRGVRESVVALMPTLLRCRVFAGAVLVVASPRHGAAPSCSASAQPMAVPAVAPGP